MNSLFQAFANAADGVLIINQEQNIIYWNRAAEDILGYTHNDVAGLACYQILKGCDNQGQLVCHKYCRMAITAFNGGNVTNYDILVHTKSGNVRWINISTFTLPADEVKGGPELVHLFRDATIRKQKEQFVNHVLAAVKNLSKEASLQAVASIAADSWATDLTNREREVLSLLAQGLNTNEIARSLSISSSTVRNHIRNILQKLHVHNRLEAVVFALKHGLVTKE